MSLLPAASHAAREPTPATVSTCFTPGPTSCAEQITDRIDAARSSVWVQAYYLIQPTLPLYGSHLPRQCRRAGLDRRRPAIAHSKVIVPDEEVVITGSSGFTKSADTRNAENVVFIDSRDVAAQFTRNWEQRRSASRRFEPE